MSDESPEGEAAGPSAAVARPDAASPIPPGERRLVLLIGAVQFINVLEFMMVMPLGPDFARELGIPTSQLGLVGGGYTLAAAAAGIAGAFFLDRFDRRRALSVALAGLVLGTALGALAVGLKSLVAARLIAGAFGGPATALSMAIVTDAVPAARRGRAMGSVMGAFSVASVLGVPAGLELARVGGWRMPFLTVAALGAVVIAVATRLLPPQRAHLAREGLGPPAPFRQVLRRPVVQLSLSCTAVAIIANFALIPNLSTYFQLNRGYPREYLSLLYMVGGAVSFATLRLAGRLVDRHGSPIVAAGGSLGFILVLLVGFIHPVAWVPVMAIFVGFMVSGSFRNVPVQALSSRVPGPGERARFLSAQSAVQHLAASAGAIAGSRLLEERAGGALIGMERLAWYAIATAILLPVLLTLVYRRVRAAESAGPPGNAG